MTKRERIAALEERIASLEARIVALEARPYVTWTYGAAPALPYKITTGDSSAPPLGVTTTWVSTDGVTRA